MGFLGSSTSPCQFTSVSLRSNEEFVGLVNDVEEARRLCLQRSRVLDNDPSSFKFWHLRQVAGFADQRWKTVQDEIWDVDQRLKRAEKYALFSDVVAGTMLQFDQKIFPALRKIRSCYEGQYVSLLFLETCFFLFDQKTTLKDLLEILAECVYSKLESAHKVVVSALVLLSFVYQYLIGCVDKGGSKTYSPGSFLFRLIFVAIVLFLGSYVWIKFRQASFTPNRRKRKSGPLADRASQSGDKSDVPKRVYRRAVKDSRGFTHYKYEPRFKPRREKLEPGTSLEFTCLSLGSYDSPREAEIVRHIAAVLYGKDEVRPFQFDGGLCLPFPSVTEAETCPASGKEKAVWVTHKTKQLYAELVEEKKRREKLYPAIETGSHHGHDVEARRSDPSPSAAGARSSAMELTCLTPPQGGNGLVEERATSESHGLRQEALPTREIIPVIFSDAEVEQGISSMPQWEETDFPAMDQIAGDNSEADRVFGFESSLVPPQSSSLDITTCAIFASLSPLGVGDQGFEIIEPHLNSATAIPVHPLESLPEQVQLQQRVTCQEPRPEELSGSSVELQQKLLESEEQVSELERKLRQSEVENEKWRSIFHQVAKLVSAADLDGYRADMQ